MGASDPDVAYRLFTTSVALVTTNGPRGPNVMAAEWTFNVSYEPFLILVSIEPGEATHEAIAETGEFGVNLLAEEQVVAMGFAGHFSKHDTDKLSSELFETVPATRIRAPLLKGCLLTAECKLVQRVEMGDHTAFVGEVVAFTVDPRKRPVVLHRGAHALGARIPRPPAIAVAATPMDAPHGGTVTVDGELTGPDRATRPVALAIVDAGGTTRATAEARTDAYGYFQATVELPPSVHAGPYAVVATSGEATGRARLVVH
jgi:flavin reductase (DIM6/NTAB) family NADH-FMN oxidoreductase RutF